MKKVSCLSVKLICAISILISCFSVSLHAQVVNGATFKARSFEEAVAPYAAYKQSFDEFSAKVDGLIEYISEILGQEIDSQMRELMTKRFNQASDISEKLNTSGLSQDLRSEFSALRRTVNSDVIAYNNRVAKERDEAIKRQQEEERRRRDEELKPKNWSGSGFALKDGYLITNYHVIEDAKVITVKGIKGDFSISYSASVAASDKYNDIALLKISDARFTGFGTIPYSVKTTISEVGEDVFVLGYPLTATMGDEIKYTTGVISSKTGFQGDVSQYQISAPIQPGNSGGPLFDAKGNLIGIVSAKHNGAENVGYAIKTSYLRNLVESFASTSIIPTNNSISSLSRTEQIKSIKKNVFLIECTSAGYYGTSTFGPATSTYAPSHDDVVVNYPAVLTKGDTKAKISKVIITSSETIVEIIANNTSADGKGYFQWANISKDTYIQIPGAKLTMTRAEGIKIAPEKTYYTGENQDLKFRLHFPPIDKSTTMFDLIESTDSNWKFEGVLLI